MLDDPSLIKEAYTECVQRQYVYQASAFHVPAAGDADHGVDSSDPSFQVLAESGAASCSAGGRRGRDELGVLPPASQQALGRAWRAARGAILADRPTET